MVLPVLRAPMSANFWTSTHCKRWLKSEAEVYDANRDLKAQATPEVEEGEIQVQPARGLKLADLTRLREWLVEFIQRLGKSLKFRTTVIATAIVYFKRFFLKTSFAEFDPMLLVPTCIYLAGKVEEHQAGCAAVVKMFDQQPCSGHQQTRGPRTNVTTLARTLVRTVHLALSCTVHTEKLALNPNNS